MHREVGSWSTIAAGNSGDTMLNSPIPDPEPATVSYLTDRSHRGGSRAAFQISSILVGPGFLEQKHEHSLGEWTDWQKGDRSPFGERRSRAIESPLALPTASPSPFHFPLSPHFALHSSAIGGATQSGPCVAEVMTLPPVRIAANAVVSGSRRVVGNNVGD
jgi:hypothetical protein